jgi:hypothetical protein
MATTRLHLTRASGFGFLSAFELRISDFLPAYSGSTENSEEPVRKTGTPNWSAGKLLAPDRTTKPCLSGGGPQPFLPRMSETEITAWQPLTPRGVAAFAAAPGRRLWLVQLIVALLAGGGVAWFLVVGYFPVIDETLPKLPPQTEIRGAQLRWPEKEPVMLAENRFLALSVDLQHSGVRRSVAHVHFEWGRTQVRVHSLLGYLPIPYPPGWIVSLDQKELAPRWGAWRFVIVVAAIGIVVVGLGVSWFGLSLLYSGPVWLAGYFLNRDLSWRAGWRLGGAALLPGALVMLVTISFYAVGVLDLVQLGFGFVAHFVVGWIYLGLAVFFVPRLAANAPPRRNPFKKN